MSIVQTIIKCKYDKHRWKKKKRFQVQSDIFLIQINLFITVKSFV